MRISPERLEEFKGIYKRVLGKDLTDAEASENASKMLRFIQLIYKPMTKADYEAIKKRQTEIRAKKSVR